MSGSIKYKQAVKLLVAKTVNFAKETTIHGVPKLVAKRLHPLERLFWITIIISAISGAVALALKNVDRYYANPTVVSLQKDFRNWFNKFPSATACFINKADEGLIDEFIEETWGLNDTDEKYDYYREFVVTISNVSYHNLATLELYKDDPSLNNINFIELAAKVHPELTGTLVTFDTKRKTGWTLVMTEMGICFSVNTEVSKYFSYSLPDANSTDDEYDESILECHFLNGLCYARYDSDPLAPLQVYVHSYLDIGHATSDEPLQVKESQELEINFRMEETSTASNLRYLTPTQRRCRFKDEPLNSDIPAYSTSICHISCRYRMVMKLCGCKPFFYNNLPGKDCDMKGLLCVSKHAATITQPPLKLGCHCPQPCSLITYLPQVPKVTVWEYGYFDQRITFRWGLLPPTTKYFRDILFGFEDLVVSIGGTVALFLGVSFITAMEIAFFIIDMVLYTIYPRRGKIASTVKPGAVSNNEKSIKSDRIKRNGVHKRNQSRGSSGGGGKNRYWVVPINNHIFDQEIQKPKGT